MITTLGASAVWVGAETRSGEIRLRTTVGMLLVLLSLLGLLAGRLLERKELLASECLVVNEGRRLDEVLEVGSTFPGSN